MDNCLFFDEQLGPGAKIDRGEDTVYLRAFLRKFKIYQLPQTAFHAVQEGSTWWDSSHGTEKDIFASGYIYKRVFGAMALPYGIYHLIKYRRMYRQLSPAKCIKIFTAGMRAAAKGGSV